MTSRHSGHLDPLFLLYFFLSMPCRVVLPCLIIITASWISSTSLPTVNILSRQQRTGTICMRVTTSTLQIWTGRWDQRTHQADWRAGSSNRPTSVTYSYHSNYRGPLRHAEDRCQRSRHYLSAIYRSEREVEGGPQRHETPSLKSVYKAQISPPLNPCGPSHPP